MDQVLVLLLMVLILGSGPGVGFAIDGVDFDKLYGKIGECSGLKPN